MKRTEMTQQQLEIFHKVIEFLENKGWNYDGDKSWFEKDLWEEPEIGMAYQNETMSLLIEYTLEKESMTLILISNQSGKELTFNLFPGQNLQQCLQYLSDNQDQISTRNYREYMNALLEICPEIYTYKGDVAYLLKPV